MKRDQLLAMSVHQLDEIYVSAPLLPCPTGRYRGTLLRWLPPACKLRNAPFVALEFVGFQVLPWGIDFDTTRWWVGAQCIQGGLFEAVPGPSRWRETQTQQLHYSKDWLPFARKYLYDEVKPLTDTICLGIGGINAPRDIGDHFYYLLEKCGAR